MTVTRDVILDLLPLYFAGQVSADTKALVESFLQSDPVFARMSHRFESLLQERGDRMADGHGEVRAFEKTRMLLRYRNQTIGIAVAYSLLPFAFLFRDGRIAWLMREKPVIAITFGLVGIVCWIVAYVLTRRASIAR